MKKPANQADLIETRSGRKKNRNGTTGIYIFQHFMANNVTS